MPVAASITSMVAGIVGSPSLRLPSKKPSVLTPIESVPAALRAITGNGVNVLAMGAFYVAPQMGCDIADAYLNASLGSGYEWWHNFYEFHKLAIDELEAFDYDEYRKAGFKVKHLGAYPLSLETKPEEYKHPKTREARAHRAFFMPLISLPRQSPQSRLRTPAQTG